MKKVKYLLILLVATFSMSPVMALENEPVSDNVEVDNKFVLETDNKVDLERNVFGSALLAGNNVTVNKEVDGIGLLVGNNVDIRSKVEYAFIGGNNIRVTSEVQKDAGILGNTVMFSQDSKIGRDTWISGNQIDLSGTFGRDVTIYASSVNFSGAVIEGNVVVHASQITIDEHTQIKGELKYNDTAEGDISSNALIGSIHKYEDTVNKRTFLDIMWDNAISFTGLLIVFAALALLAPKIFTKINDQNKQFDVATPFIYMGKGAVALILVPLVMIVAFMTVIGVPLAILLLVSYIVAFYLATMFAAYMIGYWIWDKTIKSEKNILLIGLLGVGILYVISLIPVVNTIVGVFTLLMGLGVIIDVLKKRKDDE